jgi:hypothetical protein
MPTAEGGVPQSAASRELTEQAVITQLYKTGGTPYTGAEINCRVAPGLYLSAAQPERGAPGADLPAQRPCASQPPPQTLGSSPLRR